ncbi:MAG: hypothetical protein ABIV48_11595, partial [Pyrinomonadaceae bacterium]
RGLVIDESTPEQALEILGTPKSDKPNDHWHLMRNQWFIKDIGKKLRTLNYEKIEGFKKVRLKFDSSLKLVSIHLEPKELTANVFTGTYSNIEFRDDSEVQTLGDLKRPRNPRPRPEPSYWGATFELIAASEKTIFIAGGYGGSSGRITIIEFISRTLEDRVGSELLK